MERWIIIKDHPNYEVSSCGRIRNRKTGRIMTTHVNNGFERVKLDGKMCYIHRLVVRAFYDCHDADFIVDHSNGDKLDNHVYNLRWHASSVPDRHHYVNVVYCKFCKYRSTCDIRESEDDYFYCSRGRRV